MRGKKPTISTYLDTRRPKKSGKFPVKLRVTATWLRPKQKYFPLNLDLTKDEWQRIKGNVKGKLLDTKKQIQQDEADAMQIIKELPIYTHTAFENKFNGLAFISSQVYEVFEKKIEELKEENRQSTAEGYKGALSALKKFRNNKPIYFIEVDLSFLKRFLVYLEQSQKANATIRTYFRYFQHIFNIAIEDGLIPKEHYPFSSRRLQLPKGNKVDKAVPKEVVTKLVEYDSDHPGRQFARDLWLFSYCIAGANFTDIARLTKNNIKDGALLFERGKTENKKSNSKATVIPLNSLASEIVSRYSEFYLFPILDKKVPEEGQYNRIKDVLKQVNRSLKQICKELQVDTFTFSYARHTFATQMRNMGLDVAEIGAKMGHAQGSGVTDRYIKQEADQYQNAFEGLI